MVRVRVRIRVRVWFDGEMLQLLSNILPHNSQPPTPNPQLPTPETS